MVDFGLEKRIIEMLVLDGDWKSLHDCTIARIDKVVERKRRLDELESQRVESDRDGKTGDWERDDREIEDLDQENQEK